MICQVSIVFQKQNNELIVLYIFCDTVHLHKCAAVKTNSPTHDNTHAELYSVLLCKDVLCCNDRREKKKHFNKCLITSLDSDSVHDSKIIRQFGNKDISHVNIF